MKSRTVLLLVTGIVVAPFILLAVTRSIVFDWYHVPTGSMAPTIREGSSFVPVLKCAYQIRIPFTAVRLFRAGSPRRGDIVVLRNPDGKRVPFIQRLVGLPGDTVELRNETLVVNGKTMPVEFETSSETGEEVLLGRTRLDAVEYSIRVLPNRPAFRTFGPIRVPADDVFLLGDNRDESRDSRFYGTRPLDDLLGRVLIRPANARR